MQTDIAYLLNDCFNKINGLQTESAASTLPCKLHLHHRIWSTNLPLANQHNSCYVLERSLHIANTLSAESMVVIALEMLSIHRRQVASSSSVYGVACVALAVGAAGTLVSTAALAVNTVSTAFVAVGIAGCALAVCSALAVVAAVALSRTRCAGHLCKR